jgi:hypothetical protein
MRRSIRTLMLLVTVFSSLLLLTTCDVWVSIFGADPSNILQWMPSGITQGTKEAFKISATGPGGTQTASGTLTFGLISKSDTMVSMKISTTDSSGFFGTGTSYWNASSSKKAIFWSGSDIIQDTSDTIMLQTPVKTGGSWVTTIFGTTPDWTFEIQSTKQKVDVVAGSYSDVAIGAATSPSYPNHTFTFYWSVKQGVIKMEEAWTYGGSNYSIIEELSSVQ